MFERQRSAVKFRITDAFDLRQHHLRLLLTRCSDRCDVVARTPLYDCQCGFVIHDRTDLNGQSINSQFGYLPKFPFMDVDGDRISDLMIGSPQTSVPTNINTAAANAGKISFVYGAGRAGNITPINPQTLTNKQIPALGSTLVESFQYLASLPAGPVNEAWYQFKTLGDGQIGDQIQLQMVNGDNASTARPRPAQTFQAHLPIQRLA